MQLERDGTLATLSRNSASIVVFNIVVSCIQKIAKQQTSRTPTIGSRYNGPHPHSQASSSRSIVLLE